MQQTKSLFIDPGLGDLADGEADDRDRSPRHTPSAGRYAHERAPVNPGPGHPGDDRVARKDRIVQRDTHIREGGVERLETAALPVRSQSLAVVSEVGCEEIGHD